MIPPFVSETAFGRSVGRYGVATAAFFGYPENANERERNNLRLSANILTKGGKTETASEHEESN